MLRQCVLRQCVLRQCVLRQCVLRQCVLRQCVLRLWLQVLQADLHNCFSRSAALTDKQTFTFMELCTLIKPLKLVPYVTQQYRVVKVLSVSNGVHAAAIDGQPTQFTVTTGPGLEGSEGSEGSAGEASLLEARFEIMLEATNIEETDQWIRWHCSLPACQTPTEFIHTIPSKPIFSSPEAQAKQFYCIHH